MKALQTLGTLALLMAAGTAAAHPGHGAGPALAGFLHPLGADHLLAMLAVGLWSAAALPPARQLWGPATFLATMLLAAMAGVAGLQWPGLEAGLALSVLMFGLLLAVPRALPVGAGLALVAGAAALHGLAHGTELPPGSGLAAYAGGFMATTALLHAAGLALGRALLRLPALASRLLASGLGLAGLALVAGL